MAQSKPQSTYDEVLTSLGDIASIKVFGNEILVATYIQPEQRPSGLFMPDKARDEDQWQGKVGFVIQKGALAFIDNPQLGVYFQGQNVSPGELIVYRTSDGFPIDINGVHCRLLQDTEIRMTVADPATIY